MVLAIKSLLKLDLTSVKRRGIFLDLHLGILHFNLRVVKIQAEEFNFSFGNRRFPGNPNIIPEMIEINHVSGGPIDVLTLSLSLSPTSDIISHPAKGLDGVPEAGVSRRLFDSEAEEAEDPKAVIEGDEDDVFLGG